MEKECISTHGTFTVSPFPFPEGRRRPLKSHYGGHLRSQNVSAAESHVCGDDAVGEMAPEVELSVWEG